ncbi:hypothetical protein TGRUB_285710 [Toxoplasma gondii RUB]|uniref:Thioesterase domain-containing protein n=6 Tax=Toxoplasma gondii TaxID=5811 RepID=V4Z9H0_TOXGV|nr:hypothetical protein TGVEG_285710 [Toxoplasma gondii VEG]KFG39977.1 hypothetical protein TGDOM2_285710 [Toxoplasma gondii GAB2-2007-GAL-DOM2]KFG45008.1 hypothetical protein TGP89_285710 [Toxoplasma gondii p89]KFG63330.1 hypothetical protein TGRUB_285710 [Toxoplasma gondii RUB]KFH08309.1 hypothetical protein TGVAND_285710 [Toxoplasma gondii VAND]RQX69825.1 hypothetical protein TGCAST_285710 [Toxoplasma gondii CAST]
MEARSEGETNAVLPPAVSAVQSPEDLSVMVDGAPLLSHTSVPEWAHFCFRSRAYRTVPVGGVLDAADAETRETLWDGGRTPDSPRGGEEKEKEDEYAHMLHDVLTAYGNVSELNYFVSCDPSVRTPDAVDASPGVHTPEPAGGASGVRTPEGRLSDGDSCAATSPEKKAKTGASVSSPPAAKHMLVSCHVGRRVCGHKGVVHGGFIATLLDNSLGYMAHFVFKRAATKKLEVSFVRPLLANAFIIVDVQIADIDSQKGVCAVVGTVYACIPEQLKHLGKPGKRGEQGEKGEQGDSAKPRGAEPAVPEGVWVVAAGKAIMVDVTKKWKGIQ